MKQDQIRGVKCCECGWMVSARVGTILTSCPKCHNELIITWDARTEADQYGRKESNNEGMVGDARLLPVEPGGCGPGEQPDPPAGLG